jgi:hypothetical protein
MSEIPPRDCYPFEPGTIFGGENTRRLWIDAICIKQSDLDKSNRQIRFMSSVYNSPKSILIWLGVESELSNRATGCTIPMLLQPFQDHHEVFGDVYLDEIMHRGPMKDLDEGKIQLQTFELH